MIGSIKGGVINKGDSNIMVDVHGLGFIVSLPSSELAKLNLGQEVSLYTYLVVKEDALDLYGSLEKGVIAWFKLLLNVKGIGPKSALSVMSIVKPKDLSAAIQTGKSDILIALGVGKKTAERIVLELKTKALELSAASGPIDHPALALESEALSALESLGYNREQARAALKDTPGEDVQSKIKGALRILGKH